MCAERHVLNHFSCFVVCILLGCDYCGTIKGVGPKSAHTLVQKHKNLETLIKNIDLEVRTRISAPEAVLLGNNITVRLEKYLGMVA